jgi:acyl dehydratase
MHAESSWSEWIGRRGEVAEAPYPVSAAALGYLAEAVEDERLARYLADGGDVAPRSFVTVASRIPNWRPSTATGPDTFLLALSVPVPCDSAVNTVFDQHYFAPLRIGHRLCSVSTISSIEAKTTRLGPGYLITEQIEHRNQTGELVARTDNTMFRFCKPDEPRSSADESDAPRSVPDSGTAFGRLPAVELPVTISRLVAGAGAVRDMSRLHHDVDFARAAGHRTAFLSFSHQVALVVRALGDWLSGDERVCRLQLRMKRPIYLGTTAVCTGTWDDAADDSDRARLEVVLSSDGAPCTVGFAEIAAQDPRAEAAP